MQGHHAYRDIFEPVIGTMLTLQREKKQEKINSTFVDKDSLPAPHRGYNKSYESSACKFTGFRLTFAAQKSENDQ